MKERTAEIICVGTELLMGETVNTNATDAARELAALGINVYHSVVVGDNAGRLREALALAFSRADIVIATGGLGPTYDDLTKETVAEFFGKKMVMHQPSLDALRTFFKKAGREMSPNNEKQAMMPEDCTVLPNPNGTAPGCILDDGKRIAAVLPGPPREMRPMMRDQVAPYLADKGQRLVSHSLHFYGIGESELEYRLHELMTESENPTVAPYAKSGEVMLRVTARVADDEDAEPLLTPIIQKIRDAAGEYLYGMDVPDLQTAVVQCLKKKHLTAATAESCTGGMVSSRITAVPGASGVFGCGLVCYNNEMKERLLGIPAELIEKYTAVSEETAAAMALGIRRVSGADIGIGVTGNAGPEPSEGKPVGLVYVAVSSEKYTHVSRLTVDRQDEDLRELIRHLAALRALYLILHAADQF